ncbi:MAG: SDR family oxidoreductase [Cyclobacteriaceae bacterium]|nr:SDR family oxidoreductase [Cyclobacteriaceae bacterium]
MKNAIIITGVSTGIGFELAKQFAQKGYQVLGSVRKLEDAGLLMDQYPDNFLPLVFDVTDHKAIDTAVDEVKQLLKGESLVGLINNAGIAVTGTVYDLEMEEYKHQFDVNFFGLIKVTQAFLPLLGAEVGFNGKPGRILNISSAAGQIGFPFMSPYCSSKHAVEGFSESLRRELMHLGIKVIIIGPTAIKTPIWEKGDVELPEQVKNGAFGKQAGNFLKLFSKSGEKGMPANTFAKKVVGIFEKSKPKSRYSISANAFEEWLLPRYLPSEAVDKSIAKILNRE